MSKLEITVENNNSVHVKVNGEEIHDLTELEFRAYLDRIELKHVKMQRDSKGNFIFCNKRVLTTTEQIDIKHMGSR